MTAIYEQHLSTLKKLIKYLNYDANNWTKIMDANPTLNLPKIDIVGIDNIEIIYLLRENKIVGSMCVKYLGQNLCEIEGDIKDIDQFVYTVDKLIKNIEV